ncbi:PREDICTED: probable LRR receptor-like serine/threonine-protein kinase At1g05700 [Theobroma cacao]|uniref:Probable LRR receptor-like serine/threonine-protein kinase At1g05700 n=1 Tax=Theobroma cacao TaxID=3641 RepID=A0AB32WSF9_THECC|nr:PREDICTED: probable LRR receptor-like serine/threonine-protein kinase At1g05700 [Theobroma cacao]
MATYLLFLIIAASAFSTLNADLSIDCGESDIYADDYSMGWVGDENYIQHGEAVVVQSSKSVSQAMTTLRVFTDRKKNCYSIAAGKGSQVLVRASFFYGNYDKKSSPPSFDLLFDGNHWATVETSGDEVVSHEVIYVTKRDTVSVCVAQTSPNMFPFISAIEVRSLDEKMYGHIDSNYALMLRRRVAYGTKEIIRYSDDLYDRIWVPAINGGDFTVLTSDESFIDVSLDDNPPGAVFKNAFAPNSTSISIQLGTNLPATEVPIYMNMYFSEVSVLDSTQRRSFQLYIDGKSTSNPFIPSYGKAGEMYLANFSASSNTNFSLVATSVSTLPPLINALEVFTVSDELTDGTNRDDVEGLASLQNEFDVLGDWGGDPCLPSPYSWDWINCTSASTPRVTALYLGSFGLSGFLPDFSSMTALEIIDLHNNSLIGSIPEFLGTLPNLKQLNLANNELSGLIPSSISKNTKLKLVVTGNPDLCVSGKSCKTASADGDSPTFSSSSGKKKKNNQPVILGTVIPIFVLLWVIGGGFAVLHHKRKSAATTGANAGQAGGANRPNGTPQAGKMQMPMQMAANNMAQNIVNDFRVNIQEQQPAQDQPVDQNDQQNQQGGGY